MRKLVTLFFCLFTLASFAQKDDDQKIFIALEDTTNLQQRIKIALAKNDFMIKEDGDTTMIKTFPREFKKMPGYSVAMLKIRGNVIELSGVYGLKRVNDWGYYSSPNGYKPIIYFKSSKGWKVLMQIARELGSSFTYSK